MKFLVVANFKSHKTLTETKAWLQEVSQVAKSLENTEIVVAPSFPHLQLVSKFEIRNSNFALAAQDVSPFPPGSYTGAVSAPQLKEIGVQYCIVGHSERRRYFHESVADVSSKVRELLATDITPIVCLEEQDIVPQFAALEDTVLPQCIFCYEPRSDIGGTTTAPQDQIKSVQKQISKFAPNSSFMYGGSVNAGNIDSLLALGLSGVLVATASLEPADYLSILRNVSHAA